MSDASAGGDGGWPVVRVEGDIDLSNAGTVTAAAERAVSNRASGLVLDLSGVGFLDSTGLQVVFRLARHLGDRQQRLRLVVPAGARIARLLALSGVGTVADIVPEHLPGSTSTREGVHDGS